MRALAGAAVLLWLAVGLPQSLGLKCGIRAADMKSSETVLESGFFSRTFHWRNSTVGRHPWQVSLKLGEHHFCGGSLIQDDLVITAAHCLVSLHEKQIRSLTVTAGEYNLFQKDKQEQNIPVSKITIHPEYNRLGYMSSDIALLYLKHKVKFENLYEDPSMLGIAIQPICIPHRDDKFEEWIICVASGWGKTSETSEYSNALQAVELPIMDDRTCNTVLKSMNLLPLGRTTLCARFPDGEKNACQRDSGGPLFCRRDNEMWVLVGITSWEVGCATDWAPLRNNRRRASPGIFSEVFELMDLSLRTYSQTSGNSVIWRKWEDSLPPFERGHNRLRIWKIMVPEDKIILIKFTSLDIENQVGCDHDYVSLKSSSGMLISKVCGDILPSPLLTETNEATITFVSDAENSGTGFELIFTAVRKNSEAGSGCGSMDVSVEEGAIHSADYLDLYPRNVRYHWFIHAPENHVITLAFEDLTTKFNQNCVYHAVVIYGDPEEERELAKLCGISSPPPVFSPGNMMLIHFKSDGENNFRGFKARFAFLPSDSSNKIASTSPPKTNLVSSAKAIPYGRIIQSSGPLLLETMTEP